MSSPSHCPSGVYLASRLRESAAEVAARWLDRLAARVALPASEVFPTGDLLDHVPLLVEGIANFLESSDEDIDAEQPVVAKARELGAMRHAQGFDAYQILKEHDLLGSVILAFLEEEVAAMEPPPSARDLMGCLRRATAAVEIVRQATTVHFLHLSDEQVREREDRLRRFNRMVSHELKNRVSAIRGGAALLAEDWLSDEQRPRFVQIVVSNAEALQRVLENLETLSRLESDSRQHRNILLPNAASEVLRQLRDQAQARDVELRMAEDIPAVEVNAAAVELCLTNYVSNGIKYHDPSRTDRWVEVRADFRPREASGEGGELVVYVADNGIGVPPEARADLFRQFYRAHEPTVTGAEGTGLGLSIVRETAVALGGSAWAEFPESGGSVFAFSLPSRRDEDAAAAGVTRYG